MEKIKDFFHDFSDIFFAIAITSVMFAVLTFNLGSWFNNSSNIVSADENIQIVENNSYHNPQNINEDKDKNSDLEKENMNEEEDSNKEAEENKELNSNEGTEENKVDTKNPDTVDLKTIVIPNGTPGSGVAKILKENGLIEDTKDFIQAAENLKLAIKLKSGSFKIPTNSTIEDMVKIIAGQKK